VYAQQGDTLYVNLFAAGTSDITLGNRRVSIAQQTRYPWDGAVKMTVKPQRAGDFTIKVDFPAGPATSRCQAISIAFSTRQPKRRS